MIPESVDGQSLPVGIYEELVTAALKRALTLLPPERIDLGRLDLGDAHDPLAQYSARLASRVLRAVGGEGTERLAEQHRRVNRIIKELIPRLRITRSGDGQ